MTRRIDRIHEQRRAEESAAGDRQLFAERLDEVATGQADRLRDALGLPRDLVIEFSKGSVTGDQPGLKRWSIPPDGEEPAG